MNISTDTKTVLSALALYLGATLAGCGGGNSATGSTAVTTPASDEAWFAAWGTANYTYFPNGPLTQPEFSPNTAQFIGNQAVAQSFRMMLHPSTGGDRLRLHFSNVFGDRPLLIENVAVALRALPTGPAITSASRVAVHFSGESSVSIPVGEELISDATEFSWAGGDDIAVSFHVPGPSGPMSWHAEAFASQYISAPNSGDVSADATGLELLNLERGWFFVSGLDAQLDGSDGYSIVVFGDSITDGFAGTLEVNHRYPDFLARRLQNAGIQVGVVNAGINSNRVLSGGVIEGAAGIDRFQRDVLGRSGVRSVLVLLGTNDLSAGNAAEAVYAGLRNLAEQAHAAGICIVVSTILPRNDPPFPFGWDAATEEPERQKLNQMILSSTAFDAVADLGAAMENPLLAGQPNQAYFVEGLHPNSLGMQVLADAIPLEPLLLPPEGSCDR